MNILRMFAMVANWGWFGFTASVMKALVEEISILNQLEPIYSEQTNYAVIIVRVSNPGYIFLIAHFSRIYWFFFN